MAARLPQPPDAAFERFCKFIDAAFPDASPHLTGDGGDEFRMRFYRLLPFLPHRLSDIAKRTESFRELDGRDKLETLLSCGFKYQTFFGHTTAEIIDSEMIELIDFIIEHARRLRNGDCAIFSRLHIGRDVFSRIMEVTSFIHYLEDNRPYNGAGDPLIQPWPEAGGSSGTVNDREAANADFITAGRTEVKALENHLRTVLENRIATLIRTSHLSHCANNLALGGRSDHGRARTEFEGASASGSALENYVRTVLLTSDGLPSRNANNGTRGRPFDHDKARARHNIVAAIDNLSRSLKEISDFFKGNQELARDDPTWFKTLIGINGGSITALIYKSIGNTNRNSLQTEIILLYGACCTVVGFGNGIAGLYLSTNKPKSLPFGCDPEVSTQKMGIVGGLATAFGFIAGVLLLLPNNLFRGIVMAVAFVAFTIPIFFKLRPSSESRPGVPLPGADTDDPFSTADVDMEDMV